jgi:hypothetical protein
LSQRGSLATSGTILLIELGEIFFMKVGLFVTNQQRLATDMVAALDDQIAISSSRGIGVGIRCSRGSII